MMDVIKQQVDSFPEAERLHRLREALQVLILKSLYDNDLLANLGFVGGTALRLIFNLRRFSEDLDFSLVKKEGYSFSKLKETLDYQLRKYGFSAQLAFDESKTVNSAMIKFENILYALGLSPLKSQKIAVKLEVDTNPPPGYLLEMAAVNNLYLVTVTHYDLTSLYASKLHACFFRKYTKGRDYYDLLWYLGKQIQPNFILLNNAIKQTQGKDYGLDAQNLNTFLREHVSGVDFVKVRDDVGRFLVDKRELALLEKETFLKVIR